MWRNARVIFIDEQKVLLGAKYDPKVADDQWSKKTTLEGSF